MFDISFGELLLVFVLGLIVLGPQRLPVAVRTVVGWVRALRSLASSVQSELAHELKLQELQDSLKKVEKASMDHLTPELKASMDALREAAESMKRPYTHSEPEKESDEAHADTLHRPLVTEKHEKEMSVTSADTVQAASTSSAPGPQPLAMATQDKPAAETTESPASAQPASEKP